MDALSPAQQARTRTRDRVFRAVKERLISGAHRPGEKIKIRPLAEALGTSATPVREALLQLVIAGALQHHPQHSIRVPVLTAEEYGELIHIRILLECELAGFAAKRITSEMLDRLERLAIELFDENSAEFATFKAKVADFHFTLYRAAHMPQAIPVVESLWLRTGPYLNAFQQSTDRDWGHRLRGQILNGLRKGDSKLVREALKEDLMKAREHVTSSIRQFETARD